MAKIFELNSEEEIEVIPPKKNKPSLVDYFFIFAMCAAFLIMIVVMIGEKKEISKNNKIMQLVELLEMDNGNILTEKVKYETSKKTDPQDTSDIFYEVVVGNEKLEKGDLIKFNHRFIQEQQIENKTYCVIETSQIQFHLKKKNVKKDILKRQ